MKPKEKRCRAKGRAAGYTGCGLPSLHRKYGLCMKCYPKWLCSTPEGKEIIQQATRKASRELLKNGRREHREKKQSLLTPRQKSAKAMKLADTSFSQYIRLKYAKEESGKLYVHCFTCDDYREITDFMDNGHYFTRDIKATRYDEDNCRPQCRSCNSYRDGEKQKFQDRLKLEVSMVKLNRRAKSQVSLTESDYRDIADKYREKRNTLQRIIGVKYW